MFREMMQQKGVKLGTMLGEFNTPGIGHIMKAAGLDFCFIDMEHSGFSISDLKSLLRYFEAAELPTMVRPPSANYHHIARCLDAGAEALMLPMVGSADEAKEILAHMKYPPQGHRGVALGMAHDRYRGGEPKKALRGANRKTVMIALIETVDGLENVEEIAAVKGLDALWIGHFDLSASMGIPGAFKDRRFTAATRRITKAAQANGKVLGQLVGSAGDGVRHYKQGAELIAYSVDSAVLKEALRANADAIRKKCS